MFDLEKLGDYDYRMEKAKEIIKFMELNELGDLIIPSTNDGSLMFELFVAEDSETKEDFEDFINKHCNENSSHCTHEYDCCGCWYYDYNTLYMDEKFALVEIIGSKNI